RVRDALRHPAGPAAAARAERPPPACLHQLRRILVSVVHAAPGRAPRERDVRAQESLRGMKAIVVRPRVAGSIHMRDMPDPELGAGDVAVGPTRLGLGATDPEIEPGLYGEPPEGSEFLVLGHENFGVVEAVGRRVKGWKAGGLVVSHVLRPCGACAAR